MSGFRDIHGHFIYGVDDGAQTREDMLAMLEAAHADGVTRMFATSHVTPGVERFHQDRYDRHLLEAQRYCEEKGYDMTLYRGAEILYTPLLKQPALEHELPTMGDTETILIEFVPSTPFSELVEALDLVTHCGYNPVLAHIERYECMYHGNAYRVKDDFDVRFQVNCSTVIERRGFLRRREIQGWFDDKLIDFVASDAHNCSSRRTRMREAYAALRADYNPRYAAKLVGLPAHRENKE